MAKRGNFGDCFHNHSHKQDVFTESELLMAKILKLNNISFAHEHLIKFNVDGKKHHFWLDFLITGKKISLEVNPSWHERYSPVIERDKVKKRMLAQNHHIEQIEVRVGGKIVNGKWKPVLNQQDVQNAIETIKQTQISPETLEYYIV